MISSIRLQNYRNHKDTEIEFGRLTALVGPNSAGKSNVLEGVRCFTRLPEERTFKRVFRGERDPDVIVRDGNPFFKMHIGGGEPQDWDLGVKCTVKSVEGSRQSEEKSYPTLSWEWMWQGKTERAVDAPTRVVLAECPELEDLLSGTEYFKGMAPRLSKPSKPRDVPPKLYTNGNGLASVVSHLMTTEPDRFQVLLRRLREVIPEVERLRTRRVLLPKRDTSSPNTVSNNDEEPFDELLYDMKGGEGIPAHSVSEGTLVATGLLAALTGTGGREPRLLMIDDLEQGLHPKAQRELVSVLRKILDQRPDLQIVFTTHSPYIVDELAPEETWLLNTDVDGVAHARRLSEHPDAEKSLQVLTTGEFWSAEGEEWVVGDGASDEASAQSSTE